MEDFKDSVMVALLPTTTDWCKIELPHTTLVYVGEIPDLHEGTQNELIKAAHTMAWTFPQLTLNVLYTEVFGTEHKVDVLVLDETTQLMAMYNALQKWDGGNYDYHPHATIGPEGSATGPVPETLTFDRILVSWGVASKVIYKLEGAG